MNKYSREEHLETVLKQITSHYFYIGDDDSEIPRLIDLDGENMYEYNKELYMQLMELIPEVINGKR
ncbi:hypothetical protein Barba19A_gp016 [Rheinheimera phage vB_RspM_Barba19A]|uniref:Uncharacterized protein n=2 Tax=Barbavirus barba19A TaxID=2734091 RepID=A0A4P8NHC6_9CAUD|nr:hypothetical protein HOV47_gp016 [Rheinheimera phage vB_RspM_Barba19A]QCQ61856.1 hypothetical protein Barba19A_gp016 [Rheinheimera phage vB_RspM_Barba19A]QCQ64606.1 hypothetical protein Barba31A_gp016 [Rheinheimera phage vB_RspM_Barba31A]